MKTVVFAHGFGVMKDARGMFTQIADTLEKEGIRVVLLDLNTKDDAGNIVLNTLSAQARILNDAVQDIETDPLYLICHSQGCIVGAIANIPQVKKTMFLAPPTESDYTRSIAYFSKNPESVINLDGVSLLKRRDGTFTHVPSQYWKERKEMDLASIYQTYLSTHAVVVVQATNDEVVSNEQINSVFSDTEILTLDTNHDFTDKRDELSALCARIILEDDPGFIIGAP